MTEFPEAAWTSSYTAGQNGLITPEGEDCTSNGQKCSLAGGINYSWKPTVGSTPESCTLASTNAQQFSFMLGCLAEGYNDASECDQPMRVVLGFPETFAAWKLQGNLDFCKSASSDYAISWSPAFDVASSTRQVGQPIQAGGSFSLLKKLSGVKLEAFRVSRADLTGGSGYWSLWNPDMTNNAATDSGSKTDMGTNVNFLKSITTSDGGYSWRLDTSFTPNIKLTSDEVASTYAARPDHMIVLPSDNGDTLLYRVTLIVRLFADSTQTPTGSRLLGRKRRLQYRQIETVQDVARPAEMERVEVSTRAVQLAIGSGIQAGGGGNTVTAKSTGLSAGAIGGIVALAVSAAIALAVAGVLIYRKRKQAKVLKVTQVEVGYEWKHPDKK